MEEKEELAPVIIDNDTDALPPKITRENINPNAGTTKGMVTYWVRAFIFTILSSLLIAFSAYSLITPNNFTIGGASGIAILLNVVSDGRIPQSIVLFGLNFPLVVLSFFFVKKRFAILSTANIGLQTFWLFLLEQLFPNFYIVFPGGEASKLFAALAAGICIGTATALAFKVGGSTGGADILAVMIQKKIAAGSIAWIIFAINCVIIGSSVFVFYKIDPMSGTLNYGATLLPIALSAFESYIESRTNESMTNGFQSAIEFRIITDKPDKMAAALMKELSRGVTALPATGMYTKMSHTMLICVVSRRQVNTLRRIMKQVDPESFAVMSKVSQVLGLGFYTSDM